MNTKNDNYIRGKFGLSKIKTSKLTLTNPHSDHEWLDNSLFIYKLIWNIFKRRCTTIF